MRLSKVRSTGRNRHAATGEAAEGGSCDPVPPGRPSRTTGGWLAVLATCAVIAFAASITSPAQAQSSEQAVLAQAAKSMRLGREAQPHVIEARRHFRAAAEACAELHRMGVASPELYLLWGNAELLADRVPRAIWAYHAGLRLVPWHQQLREHLATARRGVAAAQNERTAPRPDPWPTWLPAPWTSLVAAALAFTLACASAAAWRVTRIARWGWLTLAGSMLALAAASACGLATVRAQREHDHPRVVIAEADTPMNLGNGPNYSPHPQAPRLPLGAEGRLLHRRGSWLRIALPAGDVGWIPTSQALVVPSR